MARPRNMSSINEPIFLGLLGSYCRTAILLSSFRPRPRLFPLGLPVDDSDPRGGELNNLPFKFSFIILLGFSGPPSTGVRSGWISCCPGTLFWSCEVSGMQVGGGIALWARSEVECAVSTGAGGSFPSQPERPVWREASCPVALGWSVLRLLRRLALRSSSKFEEPMLKGWASSPGGCGQA